MSSTSVAVVGAGFAGLAAARALADGGRRVALFDKSRGAGGRSSTRRRENVAFDHGAQYFTAREPGFRERVAGWCERGVAARWDGRLVSLEAGRREPVPPGERFVGTPGMSALGRHLAAGLDLRTGERVAGMERAGGRWELVAESGAALGGFDAAVVATPAPQALPLLSEAPALREPLAGVGLLPCQTVLLAFDAPLEAGFDAAFVEGSPLGWLARNGSKPGRPTAECWVLQATPEWSERHLEDEPAEVIAALGAAFAEALGRALPEPVHADAHRWRYARVRRPLGVTHLLDREAGVGACGDWALGSRIEDAFRSGEALAAALVG